MTFYWGVGPSDVPLNSWSMILKNWFRAESDRAIEDASGINQVLNKSLKIRVDSKQVGTASPRYVLLEYGI